MKGLVVLTGVVDEDYEGEIRVMVNVVKLGNVYLQKGERFAQLLLLPYVKPMRASDKIRQGGFGSTNLNRCTIYLIKGTSKAYAYSKDTGQKLHRYVGYRSQHFHY